MSRTSNSPRWRVITAYLNATPSRSTPRPLFLRRLAPAGVPRAHAAADDSPAPWTRLGTSPPPPLTVLLSRPRPQLVRADIELSADLRQRPPSARRSAGNRTASALNSALNARRSRRSAFRFDFMCHLRPEVRASKASTKSGQLHTSRERLQSARCGLELTVLDPHEPRDWRVARGLTEPRGDPSASGDAKRVACRTSLEGQRRDTSSTACATWLPQVVEVRPAGAESPAGCRGAIRVDRSVAASCGGRSSSPASRGEWCCHAVGPPEHPIR